jgi:Tol biopolymer transport system component
MSPEDLKEKVILASPDRWDCPIWLPDGRTLLCSNNGKLYQIPETDGALQPLSFGNFNVGRDYCFSSDGKRLALAGDTIYLAPASGGQPTPVLPKKQAYVHGWSPDGSTVVYSATRGSSLSIYGRPINGGEEKRLTSYTGWSDSPDYSPDGKWIYFTSERSGKRSIYRVPASGPTPNQENEQRITHDFYNDWFPHPSPDGKWLLFLSNQKSGGGTPDMEEVFLRVMPLPGDTPQSGMVRETARFIGGQGTINAPCWSPDGRHFAYVRYAPRR